MATATKKKGAKKTAAKKNKKGSTKPKKSRAKLAPEAAAMVRKMLARVRELGKEARTGKKGGQLKLL